MRKILFSSTSKTLWFAPPDDPDGLEISPVLSTAVNLGHTVAFFLDEYTLAFGFQDGRIFEKLTIGDEEWKPMADSSVVNKNIRQVCQFGDEFVILGSGESHPTCFEHFEPERKLPIAGTDSRGSQIYDAKADQWSNGTLQSHYSLSITRLC